VPNSKRILSTIEPLPSPQDEPVRKKPVFEVVTGSLDIEQKSSIEPATRTRRILALWTWVWLAIAGVVTVAWAIALGWGAFALVQWIID
jgi:hypothetical protein